MSPPRCGRLLHQVVAECRKARVDRRARVASAVSPVGVGPHPHPAGVIMRGVDERIDAHAVCRAGPVVIGPVEPVVLVAPELVSVDDSPLDLSLIHISEPTRLLSISYA